MTGIISVLLVPFYIIVIYAVRLLWGRFHKSPRVHFVVTTDDVLMGACLDTDLAHQEARRVKGIVVSLPISVDYREKANSSDGKDAKPDSAHKSLPL